MELEPLLKKLGIEQHTRALSEYRDEILREKAAELQQLTFAKDAEKESALQALQAAHEAVLAEKDALIAQLSLPTEEQIRAEAQKKIDDANALLAQIETPTPIAP